MPTTRRTPTVIASAVDALAEVFEMIVDLPPSPHARALRAKADSYQRVIDRWRAIPPTAPQHEALLELVDELRVQVRGAVVGDIEPPPATHRVSESPPWSQVGRVALKPGR